MGAALVLVSDGLIEADIDDERVAPHLGRRLRRRRRLMGLTQHDLAQACGLRLSQIQGFETAALRLTRRHLMQAAAALQVGISYFYEGLEVAPAI